MPDASNNWTAGMKEVITAILGLGVAVVTLSMIAVTFSMGGKQVTDPTAATALKDAFGREKDVLLYGLSLLGAVIGYYFGRVPAELHAQQAVSQVNQAQTQLQQVQTKLIETAGMAAQAGAARQQQAQDFKSTLIAVKQNLQQAAAAPVLNIKAPLQNTGRDQAIAEIDEALKGL